MLLWWQITLSCRVSNKCRRSQACWGISARRDSGKFRSHTWMYLFSGQLHCCLWYPAWDQSPARWWWRGRAAGHCDLCKGADQVVIQVGRSALSGCRNPCIQAHCGCGLSNGFTYNNTHSLHQNSWSYPWIIMQFMLLFFSLPFPDISCPLSSLSACWLSLDPHASWAVSSDPSHWLSGEELCSGSRRDWKWTCLPDISLSREKGAWYDKRRKLTFSQTKVTLLKNLHNSGGKKPWGG